MTAAALALLVALLAAAPASAAGADFRVPAAEAYRSGRFDPGIRAVREALARMGETPSPVRAEALYLLGRLELRKGELLAELGLAARRHAADHLARLVAGPTPLRRAAYFLGVARMELGDRDGAASAFRKALRAIPASATGEDRVTRQLAELRLEALRGRVASPGAASRDPRLAAEAGYLLATLGKDPARGAAIADAALAAASRSAGDPPASVLRAAAGARLAAGRVDDAIALLEEPAAHRPASSEASGPHLTVTYYDVAVLRVMAEAYVAAAARHLEAALAIGEQPNLREAAAFAAARARLLAGESRLALERLSGLERPTTLGPAGWARVTALVARARAALGARAEAARLFEKALAEAGGDGEALAEVADLVADAHARGEVDASLVRTVFAQVGRVADGWPRRLPPRLAAGLAALASRTGGDAWAVVAQFERGRDKAAKNRLDANDPVVLARLALAQVEARLFSEALEIYFEMAKAYPEVRQVQEALQGVYAAEQVAGGEVRIN